MYRLMNWVGPHTLDKLHNARNNLPRSMPVPNGSQTEVWHVIRRVRGGGICDDEVTVALKGERVNKHRDVAVCAALVTRITRSTDVLFKTVPKPLDPG